MKFVIALLIATAAATKIQPYDCGLPVEEVCVPVKVCGTKLGG